MSHCEHCPQKGTGRGCPAWVGPESGTIILETNTATGEERPVSGCFYQVMPRLMVEVIKASNRPAAAIESTRNEIASGLARLAGAMPRLLSVDAIEVQAIGGGETDHS